MPVIDSAQGQNNYKRIFAIGRETEDKKSPPRFFEWVKEPVEVLPKGASGSRQKIGANGKTRNYVLWPGWSGTLIDLLVEDIAYGDGKPERTLIAALDDEIDVVEVHLPFYKTYARDLLKRLLGPNFEPKASLSMQPYAMDRADGGAQNIGIACKSGANKLTAKASDFGNSLPDPHLKEMPPVSRVILSGEEVANYTDQCNWLWDRAQKQIVPRLCKFGEAPAKQVVPSVQGINTNVRANHFPDDFPQFEVAANYENATAGDNSDLPF